MQSLRQSCFSIDYSYILAPYSWSSCDNWHLLPRYGMFVNDYQPACNCSSLTDKISPPASRRSASTRQLVWATLFHIGLATPASLLVQIILYGIFFICMLQRQSKKSTLAWVTLPQVIFLDWSKKQLIYKLIKPLDPSTALRYMKYILSGLELNLPTTFKNPFNLSDTKCCGNITFQVQSVVCVWFAGNLQSHSCKGLV